MHNTTQYRDEQDKELLSQSKLKAEKLGLLETDVVLDMAIYAKAVEVMLNATHIHIKQFIILRFGGFHTICIFITGLSDFTTLLAM